MSSAAVVADLRQHQMYGSFLGSRAIPIYGVLGCPRVACAGLAERAQVGVRSREWTAIADSEVGALLEMARCLREISAGRVPR